jgi:hypothetical protein
LFLDTRAVKPLAIVFATLEAQGTIIPHYSTILTIATWVKTKETRHACMLDRVSVFLNTRAASLWQLYLQHWSLRDL